VLLGAGPTATYYPLVEGPSPSVAARAAGIVDALIPNVPELSADVYDLIVQEIPELRGDKRILALLEASVGENIATVLHVIQHDINLEKVRAPAAAQEYARRLAQRGVPLAALLRAYRIGAARVQDCCLKELSQKTDNAAIISDTGLRISGMMASYIDKVSEELVRAFEEEKESWLRNLSVARASRVRAILRNEPVDVAASEAILGYRLRQYHLGVVTWITGPVSVSDTVQLLEQATRQVAAEAQCEGRPMFVPQDESSAWAWLPLGAQHDVTAWRDGTQAAGGALRFAFGTPAHGVSGFRRTHQQALSAQSVALAAGSSGQSATSFDEVAPVALMSGSIPLLRAWVMETLGALADDNDQNARLRDTLRVFLQENGSYKATAERLTLHKNTVQYRVRKAEESLGHPVGKDRVHVELALMASQWLGVAVLRCRGA
jgi:DNA-binding PucR family transcriptional regulator